MLLHLHNALVNNKEKDVSSSTNETVVIIKAERVGF